MYEFDDLFLAGLKADIDRIVSEEGRVPENWHDAFGPTAAPLLPEHYNFVIDYLAKLRAEFHPTPAQQLELLARRMTADMPAAAPEKRPALLPVRHLNRDFFLCDLFDYSLKDDATTMEAPIFSLSTKPDLDEWRWESQDGSRWVEVIPSVRGRATQFDKDVLIYIASQMTEALNRERQDADKRTVRFVVYDYLVATNKPIGGYEYERLEKALFRLKGTMISTNIETGGSRVKRAFGLIDDWTIVEKSKTDERMIAVEVTISKWLHRAIQAFEVLTIHPDYFRLRKPLERRLYELARKHCGGQAVWRVGLPLLAYKAGSKATLKKFREMLLEIISAGTIPDYRFQIEGDQVLVYTRDGRKLARAIVSNPKRF